MKLFKYSIFLLKNKIRDSKKIQLYIFIISLIENSTNIFCKLISIKGNSFILFCLIVLSSSFKK